MHEMGIAIQIADIVAQSVPPDDAVRIRSVRLRLGKLAAVVPESLRQCFAVVARGTRVEGALLLISEVGVSVACRDCDAQSDIERLPFACATCGSGNVEIVAGREMIVESVEVD
mgnify:CR=1 FL=1